MRRRTARRCRRLRFRTALVLCAVFWSVLSVWAEKRLPLIGTALQEAAMMRHAEKVIAQTVPDYLETLSVQTEDTLVLPDTYAQSRVKAALTCDLQEKLSGKVYAWVPVGNLTGLMLLNGHGMKVPVVIAAECAVQIAYETEMEAVGINRTRYGVYMTVSARLYSTSVSVPACVTTETQYPVYEAVLEGEVPQTAVSLP